MKQTWIPHRIAPPRLVAVVVTHNRLNQIQITLSRLLETAPDLLAHVVVFDNASSDGTQAWLGTQTDPRVDVLRSEDNIGGAGGFEAGMRYVTERYDPDWIVVMDDDARPNVGALEAFLDQDRSAADAWGGAVFQPDGGICQMNRPFVNPFWNIAVLRRVLLGAGREGFLLGAEEYKSKTPLQVDGASFVGFFVSRECVARVGFPDGDLFIYGDDVIYSLNLRIRGGEILFDPTLHFEHDCTTIVDADHRFNPLWKSYFQYRNRLMSYRLRVGPWFYLVGPLVAFKGLLKVRFHTGQRWAFLRLMTRALRDGFLGRKDVSLATVQRWSGEE